MRIASLLILLLSLSLTACDAVGPESASAIPANIEVIKCSSNGGTVWVTYEDSEGTERTMEVTTRQAIQFGCEVD